MKKHRLILLLAAACHGQAHAEAASAVGNDPGTAAVAGTQRDPTVGKDTKTPLPATTTQPGAINPATGQYYPPTGNGDVINPATGERYIGTPGGFINPNTGEFMPRIR
nr:hypothetical protein [uncultured Noviherbaspirillum sp.]